MQGFWRERTRSEGHNDGSPYPTSSHDIHVIWSLLCFLTSFPDLLLQFCLSLFTLAPTFYLLNSSTDGVVLIVQTRALTLPGSVELSHPLYVAYPPSPALFFCLSESSLVISGKVKCWYEMKRRCCHSTKQQHHQRLWQEVWKHWVVYRDVWASCMILHVRACVYAFVCVAVRVGATLLPNMSETLFLWVNHILAFNESQRQTLPSYSWMFGCILDSLKYIFVCLFPALTVLVNL